MPSGSPGRQPPGHRRSRQPGDGGVCRHPGPRGHLPVPGAVSGAPSARSPLATGEKEGPRDTGAPSVGGPASQAATGLCLKDGAHWRKHCGHQEKGAGPPRLPGGSWVRAQRKPSKLVFLRLRARAPSPPPCVLSCRPAGTAVKVRPGLAPQLGRPPGGAPGRPPALDGARAPQQPPWSVSELLGLGGDARCPAHGHGQHQQLPAGRAAAAPAQAEAPGEDVHQPVCQRGAETGCHIQGAQARDALDPAPGPAALQTHSGRVQILACCVVLGGSLNLSELQLPHGRGGGLAAHLLGDSDSQRARKYKCPGAAAGRGGDGTPGLCFQPSLCLKKSFILRQVLEFHFERNLQSMVANSTSAFIWTSKYELEI